MISVISLVPGKGIPSRYLPKTSITVMRTKTLNDSTQKLRSILLKDWKINFSIPI